MRAVLGQVGDQEMSEVWPSPVVFFILSLQERDEFSNCKTKVGAYFFSNYIVIDEVTGESVE